jgi:hypothetical protein
MSPTSIDGSIASTPTRLPSIDTDTVATRRELGALGALGAVAGVNLEEVLRLYRDSNGAAGAGVPQLAAPKMTAAQASERIRANTAAAPFFSVDDMTVQLNYMQSLTDGLVSQRQMSDIRGSQADMKQKNAQQLEKVKKWLNDMDQEASARKTSGIWGWVKNVFSVVASGVAAFLAIAASPFTGGASLALAVIAVGAFLDSLQGMVFQALKEAGVEVPQKLQDIFGSIFTIGGIVAGVSRLAGAPESATAWVKMGIDLVVGIATGVAVWKSAGAVGNTVAKISNTAKMWTAGTQIGADVLSAGAGSTQAAVGLDAAGHALDAANAQADNAQIMAEIARIRTVMEGNVDELKKAADQAQSVMQMIMGMLRDSADMSTQISTNLGRGGTRA